MHAEWALGHAGFCFKLKQGKELKGQPQRGYCTVTQTRGEKTMGKAPRTPPCRAPWGSAAGLQRNTPPSSQTKATPPLSRCTQPPANGSPCPSSAIPLQDTPGQLLPSALPMGGLRVGSGKHRAPCTADPSPRCCSHSKGVAVLRVARPLGWQKGSENFWSCGR